jgi:hypothetical protein
MVILDANIVVVALPSIDEALSFSEQGLQWVISAYAITFAGLLLLGGRAADLLGRRRVFMVGLLFFTLASLLCGFAWSSDALIGARAFQGIGAAIMTPTALSIISTTFEGAERNKAFAIWGMNGAFGRGLPGGERRCEPARRADRGLPIRLRGLRRPGRDRRGLGAPAARSAAPGPRAARARARPRWRLREES